MDALLSRLGVQAMNYAIRSGIALTSTYAVSQCSRLMKTVDDKGVYAELKILQKLLDSKIKIISPALDLIEFKAGRGNIFLESAVPLAKSLNQDIAALGKRLERVAAAEEESRLAGSGKQTAEAHNAEILLIIKDIKNLLSRIDRDIPAIQLAITSSGETLSTSLPPGISPSRLLQASTFLTVGDTQFAQDPRPIQIGPSFTLSLYMLFLGHASGSPSTQEGVRSGLAQTPERHLKAAKEQVRYGFGEGERKPIWQEVIHKCRVRLCRTPLRWTFKGDVGYSPPSVDELGSTTEHMDTPFVIFGQPNEYAYHLEIIEDLDDGRVHDEDTVPSSFDNIERAGIRESIPIHQVSKIFYADTGRILNIGNTIEDSNPVLLLKRDISRSTPDKPPIQLVQGLETEQEDQDREGEEPDDQVDIDKQLLEESNVPESAVMPSIDHEKWRFPKDLDPEWLALEVFVEDEDTSSETQDEDSAEEGDVKSPSIDRIKPQKNRSSLDSKLIAQIKNLSLRSSSRHTSRPGSRDANELQQMESPESFVARSPFGAITSSLSLMEMLIRLTSLQEFQQASHLSIPDYILTFFLEETSTTGLRGEERWKVRNEAKRRVGFDPYTDTPTK